MAIERAMFTDGLQMPLCPVTLVGGKAVLRMFRIELDHQPVASDLGNDRRGSNRKAFSVAFDNALRFARKPAHWVAIDQREVGKTIESGKRGGHRLPRRLQNID